MQTRLIIPIVIGVTALVVSPSAYAAEEACKTAIPAPVLLEQKRGLSKIGYQARVRCNQAAKVRTILRLWPSNEIVAFKTASVKAGKTIKPNGYTRAKGCYQFYTQVFVTNRANQVIYNQGSEISKPLC